MSADAKLTGGKNYLDVMVFVSLGFSCDTGCQAMFQAMGRADTAPQGFVPLRWAPVRWDGSPPPAEHKGNRVTGLDWSLMLILMMIARTSSLLTD